MTDSLKHYGGNKSYHFKIYNPVLKKRKRETEMTDWTQEVLFQRLGKSKAKSNYWLCVLLSASMLLVSSKPH